MKGRLLAVAATAVAACYGGALRFDLHCDDLIVMRPWSWAELASVWHGTWEPQHAWAVFFRPLAAWFYAGSFEAFGLHAAPHLLLSLILLTLVAWLIGVFVARDTGAWLTGALAIVIFAVHPNTPMSSGAWVTNDFHKLALLAVLGTLLLWQSRRDAPLARWWPLLLTATAAFLIKEDNVLLLPAVAALHLVRAYWLGIPARHRVAAPVIALAAAAGLTLWRTLALGEIGGFLRHSGVEQLTRNLLRGPLYVLAGLGGDQAHVGWAPPLIALLVVTVIVLALKDRPAHEQWPAIGAAVLMAMYAAPLVLISASTRYYVLTTAGAMLLAVGARTLWMRAHTAPRRWLVAVGGLVIVAFAVPRQQATLHAFAPCSALDLDCVGFALSEMPLLPPEARAVEAALPSACRTGRPPKIGEEPTLTWGLGTQELDTADGTLSRRASTRIVSLIAASHPGATFRLRHAEASPATPVTVQFTIDGAPHAPVVLTSPDWTTIDVTFAPSWRVWLRAAHRADIRVSADGLDWRAPVLTR